MANFCSHILKYVTPIWYEEKYIETAVFIQVIVLHCTFSFFNQNNRNNKSIYYWSLEPMHAIFWNCLEIEIESINYWQYCRITVLLTHFTFQSMLLTYVISKGLPSNFWKTKYSIVMVYQYVINHKDELPFLEVNYCTF